MNKKTIYIIVGIAVILVIAYLMAKTKKPESGFEDEKDVFTDMFGEENPQCPEGQEWMDSLPGCVDKDKESSYTLPFTAPRGYEYYATPQNQANCGSGCKYWAGICWCLRYSSKMRYKNQEYSVIW